MGFLQDIITRKIVNPRIEVAFKGDDEFTVPPTRDRGDDRVTIEFDLPKDLEEEPNQGTITIYNLDESERKRISGASDYSAPVEVFITPHGKDELVKCFVGEIETATHTETSPGHATVIDVTCQKLNHSYFYFEKTYSKGTLEAAIINDMVKAIGLPSNMTTLPVGGLMLSETFDGPAFLMLREKCQDLGLQAWINDGVLYIDNLFTPVNISVEFLNSEALQGKPEPTSRRDDAFVEIATVVESTAINPLAKRKKTKEVQVKGKNDYTSYTAVDTLVEGVHLVMFAQPQVQTNQLIYIDTPTTRGRLYRVKEINHHGESEFFSDWTTEIWADVIEDTFGITDSLLG